MSCSCCCRESPRVNLLDGKRRRSQLMEEEEEEEAGGEEEQNRRNMDICVLQDQYRWTRDTQRTRTQVNVFRKVSEELTDAISIIPVNQGLSSSLEPSSPSPLGRSPPVAVVDPGLLTYDPWHVHLDLHRRSCPSGPPVSRCSSVSSESRGRNLSESDSQSSSVERSSCSSVNSTKEEETPTEDKDPRAPDKSTPQSFTVDPLTGPPQNPPDGISESQEGPGDGSDDSSTPVASASGSTTNLHQDALNAAPPQGYRKPPSLRVTRQLSVGGLGYNQTQNHYPFPSRRTPRISEAARRLGMYSSV